MRRIRQPGFTIIETMLFLGVTGLMVVGFLFGAGRSIGSQRYKDSVNSFQAIIQQQYYNVSNTINNHDNTWSCDSAGVLSNFLVGVEKGQSNCVILGKLIRTDGTDGKKIKINDVIGSIPYDGTGKESPTTGLDDITIFNKANTSPLPKGYGVYVSTIDPQEQDISWGASLSKSDGTPLEFSMLIVRSPLSGAVRTFYTTTSEPDNDITNLINAGFNADQTICVKSEDLFSIKPMAIKIVAGAANASGIEVLGENESGCS